VIRLLPISINYHVDAIKQFMHQTEMRVFRDAVRNFRKQLDNRRNFSGDSLLYNHGTNIIVSNDVG